MLSSLYRDPVVPRRELENPNLGAEQNKLVLDFENVSPNDKMLTEPMPRAAATETPKTTAEGEEKEKAKSPKEVGEAKIQKKMAELSEKHEKEMKKLSKGLDETRAAGKLSSQELEELRQELAQERKKGQNMEAEISALKRGEPNFTPDKEPKETENEHYDTPRTSTRLTRFVTLRNRMDFQLERQGPVLGPTVEQRLRPYSQPDVSGKHNIDTVRIPSSYNNFDTDRENLDRNNVREQAVRLSPRGSPHARYDNYVEREYETGVRLSLRGSPHYREHEINEGWPSQDGSPLSDTQRGENVRGYNNRGDRNCDFENDNLPSSSREEWQQEMMGAQNRHAAAMEQLAAGFKAMSVPDIQVLRTDDPSELESFSEQFLLKYGMLSNSQKKTTLLSKLGGKALEAYRALPSSVLEQPIVVVFRALKESMQGRTVADTAKAFLELSSFKKKQTESIGEMCSRLERLTDKAYQSFPLEHLQKLRCKHLLETVSHWNEFPGLVKLCGGVNYDALKRELIERDLLRDNMKQFRNREHTHSQQPSQPVVRKTEPKQFEEQKVSLFCSKCRRTGHTDKTCRSSAPRRWQPQANAATNAKPKVGSPKKGIPAAFLENAAIHACTLNTDSLSGYIGEQSLIEAKIAEVKMPVLGDSGSQISLISTGAITEVSDKNPNLGKVSVFREEAPAGLPTVTNASKEPMAFIGAAELPVSLDTTTARVKFLVLKHKEPYILLGTNAFPSFGIQLVRAATETKGRQAAAVASRTVLPAMSEKMVPLKRPKANASSATLISAHNAIDDSVHALDESSETWIVARNVSTMPLVLKEDQTVGEWDMEETELLNLSEVLKTAPVEPMEPVTCGVIEIEPSPERYTELIKVLGETAKRDLPREIQAVIHEYQDVFALRDEELGQTDLVEHSIETGDHPPIRQKQRPVPVGLRIQLQQILDEMEQNGVIEPSSSPWASPVVLQKKKDGSLRVCIDYRKVNQVCKHDAYPLPLIDTQIQNLAGAKVFSSLDLVAGYWQIKLEQESQPRSAFAVLDKLYQFRVLPFGLATSPARFQRLMNDILGDLIGKTVHVYLDDVLVATKSEAEHIQVLTEIFERFREHRLRFKAKKCALLTSELSYLGHRLTKDGLLPELDKIEKIKEYPRPVNREDLMSFLGLAGYYRKFVCGFASIAQPLHALTAKTVKWSWNAETEKAFNELKDRLSSAPILSQPQFELARSGERPFVIYTDASGRGLGGVLTQRDDVGNMRPLYYASKGLSAAERNYHVTDAEALAVVFALRKFKHFVYGLPVIVRTDHQPLTALFTRTNISNRVLRWSLEVQDYNVQIEYIKGKINSVADALSRGGSVPDNDDVPLETTHVVCELLVEPSWRAELQNEEPFKSIVNHIENDVKAAVIRLPGIKRPMHVADFVLDGKHLYVLDEYGQSAKVVPSGRRRELVDQAHQGVLAGHFSPRKICRILRKEFYWPSMLSDVTRWLRECTKCVVGNPTTVLTPPLQPVITQSPFELVEVDLIDMGRTSEGNRYVLTILDHFSKHAHGVALPTKEGEVVARALVTWMTNTGHIPLTVHSDQGKEFDNEVLCHAENLLGTQHSFTRGYDSRGNGGVERLNRTLEQILRKTVVNPVEWDKKLPFAIWAYNSAPHSTTGESPYFLLYGKDPRFPWKGVPDEIRNMHRVDIDEYKTELVANLQMAWDTAHKEMKKRAAQAKKWYDRETAVAPEKLPKVGDRVLVKIPGEKGASKHPKLTNQWRGPYRVTECTESSATVRNIYDESDEVRVPMDALRMVPREMLDEPVNTVKRRAKAKPRPPRVNH